jgi:hypothetical protein
MAEAYLEGGAVVARQIDLLKQRFLKRRTKTTDDYKTESVTVWLSG